MDFHSVSEELRNSYGSEKCVFNACVVLSIASRRGDLLKLFPECIS